MKKLIIILLLLPQFAFSQEKIQISIKNNRLFSLIRFVESLAGGMNTSGNMRKLYELSEGNKKAVDSLIAEYNALNKYADYQLAGYPSSRLGSYGSTWTTLLVTSANCESFDELKTKLAGTIPNETLEHIGFILKKLDPVFEQLIWKKTETLRTKQCEGLAKFIAEKELMKHFTKIRKFYGAVWPNNLPYTVVLNPMPSLNKGFTNQATVLGNLVIVDTNVDSEAYQFGATVMFHEMCHSMSMQQSQQLQQDIEKWFLGHSSPNKKLAYNLMEEGFATPAGEWIYKQITGKTEDVAWYNDVNIDTFSKAFYSKVEAYIDAGKTIDKPFVEEAIKVFDQQFPEASIDYISLFRKALFWTDAERYNDIRFAFNQQFNSTSSMSSTPILDDSETLKMVNSSEYLNVIVVTTENKKTLAHLVKNIPTLRGKSFKAKKQFVFTNAIDGNAVILVNIFDVNNIKVVVDQLVKDKKMNLQKGIWYF